MSMFYSSCLPRYQKRVSNIIDDMLEWSPKMAITGMMETRQNETNQMPPDQHPADVSNNTATTSEPNGGRAADQDLGGSEQENDASGQ